MSVAFRRESDEEHKEPRFELPLPPGPNLVTARGLAQIEAHVAEREAAVQQPLDDDTLAIAQRELRYWRTRLATAQLAPPPPADQAAFGSRVTFTLNGQRKSVDIVGDDEADPHAGLISFSAPLARALIGAGVGDVADFGGKADAIEILAVAPRDA
ncbi:GreA/GreB family elongation factor [Allosphingosinicella deserti]|uniref:Nucleoside-diphosphate kinase n=1 Tax=Allosphingosinicella deserti TaxID=2116704 RepID=A0A2P7QFF7_9SPHN|nr:GreA/GreB family elongation factor [Sphingomonas deserti]PSJ36699.1 nucleoside-diphosphate kinase [Sphingomonas deserti]